MMKKYRKFLMVTAFVMLLPLTSYAKNTIGTYLHGPLLARNENLCKKIIEKII